MYKPPQLIPNCFHVSLAFNNCAHDRSLTASSRCPNSISVLYILICNSTKNLITSSNKAIYSSTPTKKGDRWFSSHICTKTSLERPLYSPKCNAALPFLHETNMNGVVRIVCDNRKNPLEYSWYHASVTVPVSGVMPAGGCH